MRYVIIIFVMAVLITSCTKSVPEPEKKITKTSEEENAENTILGFEKAFNEKDIEKAISFFDSDYKGIVADSDDLAGIDALQKDLKNFNQNYPEGKLEISIDEGNISGDFGYFICTSSFLTMDIIEKKMTPIYSERSIKILRKGKNGFWKIFRSVSVPAFTYDQK